MSELSANYKKNKIVKFTVTEIPDYGVFGLIDGRVKCFVHERDFSWTENLNPNDVFNIGDVVDAVVLGIDERIELIRLGVKQLVENPWGDFFDKYKENTIVKFEINSVCDYGVYGLIDGKARGLIHLTELSWTECLNPNDIFSVGEVVDAVVLEINEGRKLVKLGVKQLVENPWEVFLNKNNKGDVVGAEVRDVLNYGVIMKLPEGVTGTLHNDDISYDEDYRHSFFKGQKVDVILLGLDAEKERISLGVKQINPSKWDKFMECNKTGTIVNALIKEFHGETMIAKIGDGIEASVKIKLDESGKKTNKPLGIGAEMKAKILFIDKRNRTIGIACLLKD